MTGYGDAGSGGEGTLPPLASSWSPDTRRTRALPSQEQHFVCHVSAHRGWHGPHLFPLNMASEKPGRGHLPGRPRSPARSRTRGRGNPPSHRRSPPSFKTRALEGTSGTAQIRERDATEAVLPSPAPRSAQGMLALVVLQGAWCRCLVQWLVEADSGVRHGSKNSRMISCHGTLA